MSIICYIFFIFHSLCRSNEADYSGENYVKPWIRCQPYIIGIALGFILHITKKKKIRMSR